MRSSSGRNGGRSRGRGRWLPREDCGLRIADCELAALSPQSAIRSLLGCRISLYRQRRYLRPTQTPRPMPSVPKKLRKQYVNSDHPFFFFKQKTAYEIVVKKGGGKTFDAYAGETIKVLAVYDKTSGERELVESRKADEFPDA